MRRSSIPASSWSPWTVCFVPAPVGRHRLYLHDQLASANVFTTSAEEENGPSGKLGGLTSPSDPTSENCNAACNIPGCTVARPSCSRRRRDNHKLAGRRSLIRQSVRQSVVVVGYFQSGGVDCGWRWAVEGKLKRSGLVETRYLLGDAHLPDGVPPIPISIDGVE